MKYSSLATGVLVISNSRIAEQAVCKGSSHQVLQKFGNIHRKTPVLDSLF